ncbi:hypothetical protein [Thioclava indica]|mgnify:CR=1 FL=1|uniref:Uncharacterized protein n=1 Tax=Thioclava indica TaxID=1353528 RepID=A0A074JSF3_9RHOB|nr:hypothetical protein [Thioclava indica]KEO52287.1 hypothetical protein DT23_08350 [Thioclava indica]
MRKFQKVTMVAGTFLLAAATGHVMQSVNPESLVVTPRIFANNASPTIAARPNETPRLQLSRMTVLHNPPTQHIAQDTGVGAIPQMPANGTGGFVQSKTTSCKDASLDLSLVPPGALSVALSADCARNTALDIQDGSLKIAAHSDAEGNWQGLLPAMQVENKISVNAKGAMVASAHLSTPEITKLDRVIFSAQSGSEMHLNIYEKGAGFDGSGHISVATPRTPDTPLGGYMMRYDGPNDTQIEVYTAPTTLSPVRMQIETEVTLANCGKTVSGSVRRVLAGEDKPLNPIEIDMPSCEALGQFVVFPLPNLQDGRSRKMTQK